MRKVSKKKVIETSPIEDMPKGEREETLRTVNSYADRIKEIIDSGRRSALEVVSEMMCITFEEVVEMLHNCAVTEEELSSEKHYYSNVSTDSLATMLSESKKDQLREYLLGRNKASLIMTFLDFRTLSKESLQSEYKKAFEKWTLEEEMILTGLYNEGKSWREISDHLQRNINAIKIRIEKLGLASDTGAKRRF